MVIAYMAIRIATGSRLETSNQPEVRGAGFRLAIVSLGTAADAVGIGQA
jgi:hypothetical protein